MHIPRRSAHVFVKYWGNEYSKVIGSGYYLVGTLRSGYCQSVKCPLGYYLRGMCPEGSVLRNSVLLG